MSASPSIARRLKVLWLAPLVGLAVLAAACQEDLPVPTPYPDYRPPGTPPATVATGVATPSATPTATPSPTPTATPPPTPEPRALVRAGGAAFIVEVASTLTEQATGLSGRDRLPKGAGMLFPLRVERIPAFWMRGMRFSLDFLWISADCRLLEVTPDVPPAAGGPDAPANTLPIYSPSRPVLFVLEINAGEAAASGLRPGAPVLFTGPDLAGLGCGRV